MKRICVVVTTRGNYAKTKSMMRAINAHPDLELQLVAGGALLGRQSAILDEIKRDGFVIDRTLDYMMAAETPDAVGIGAALCTMRMVTILNDLRPDILFVIADRYESLSIAQAALCCNVLIAHLEGGEVSGSIDERIRHAITKLAHFHFPANAAAADRIEKMGEHRDLITVVGSPSFDLLRDADGDSPAKLTARIEPIAAVDITRPFLLVSQHPVVTEYDQAESQFRILVESVYRLRLPAIWIWPNNDAGAAAIARPLEWLRAQSNCPAIALVTALPIEEYGAALSHTVCLLGNSSSGLREAAFLGTPSVNIGTRQASRGRAENVTDVACEIEAIVAAVHAQIAHGRYVQNELYGDGRAGETIASILAKHSPNIDKTIAY